MMCKQLDAGAYDCSEKPRHYGIGRVRIFEVTKERIERTWVVRPIGRIGPTVTIPASKTTRTAAFEKGVLYLRKHFAQVRSLKSHEFECSLHAISLGPVFGIDTRGQKK